MGFNKKTHLTIRIVQKTSPSLSEKQTNVKKYSPSRKKENNNSHYQMRVCLHDDQYGKRRERCQKIDEMSSPTTFRTILRYDQPSTPTTGSTKGKTKIFYRFSRSIFVNFDVETSATASPIRRQSHTLT